MNETQNEAEAPVRLLVLGDGSVRTISLEGQRWTVGRSQDCTITLRDPTVSRRHLLLERIGNSFHFRDLGSSNPPQLDGQPTREGELRDGQVLTLGLTRLELQHRERPQPVETGPSSTIVLSRQVLDEDDRGDNAEESFPATAAKVLQRIEWTFADLGDLAHAAEPLLDLAMNLTRRRAGWIARFHDSGPAETLATARTDPTAPRNVTPRLPEAMLSEARRIAEPHLVTTREQDGEHDRLIVPLGSDSTGMLVLADPDDEAPEGQELLRLARSLGAVVWHRLQETLERSRLRDELERLRFHGSAAHNALLTSTRLQPTREILRTLAGSVAPVLLVGERGTEREDLARYLHAESPRRGEPFFAYSPSKATRTRQATELLGNNGAPGQVQRAGGGTLFIDQITSLHPDVQRRLFETVEQAGAAGAAPRLVFADDTEAACDADSAKLAQRLRTALSLTEPVRIPPLRDDARDVLALAELFLSELGTYTDGSPRLMTERTKGLLTSHTWPGNVRELRLTIEAAAAHAGSQPIAPRHLPRAIVDGVESGMSLPTLEEMERTHIAAVMQATGGIRARAAQVLGIANSTLYEKLKKYDIRQ